MSSLSFARIMYGTNEDLHVQGNVDSASRTVATSVRSAVSTGESSSANFSVAKLLGFARLFLDGKGQ
jgi:hypothetical protein